MSAQRRAAALGAALALIAANPKAAVADSAGGDLKKQVALCKLVDAIVDTPCAGKFIAETLVPALVPVKVSGIHFEKEKHRFDKEFDLSLVIEKLTLTPVAGSVRDLQVQAHVSAEVKVTKVSKVDEEKLYKGRTYSAQLDLGGTLKLIVAPGAADCTDKALDWSMLVLGFQFDTLKNVKIAGKLDVKIPNILTDSAAFLRILDHGVNHAYQDFPDLHARGIAICLTKGKDGKANCPPPANPKSDSKDKSGPGAVVVSFGGSGGEAAFAVAKSPSAKPVTDNAPLCALATSVLAGSCAGPIVNSVAQAILPLRRGLPKEATGADGIELVAQQLTVATSAQGLSLTAKVALAKPGEPDFAVAASGAVGLDYKCTGSAISLAIRPALTQLTSDPNLPRWLLDGVGASAINRKLAARGPIELPLRAKRVEKLNRDVSTCALARALLKTASTDDLVSTVLRSLLPFDLRAGAVVSKLKNAAAKEKIGAAANDLSLVLREVLVEKGAAATQKLRVSVELRKDHQAEALLTEADLLVDAQADCGKGRDVLVLKPAVDSLKTSKLPPWLLGSTVLDVVNAALAAPKTACLMGDCAAPVAAAP